MKFFLLRWFTNAVALLVIAFVVPGIYLENIPAALAAALLLGLLNAFLRPFLLLVTLPINVLSLGLFTFVINALLLYGVSALIVGFTIDSFWAALAGALLFSVVSFVLNTVAGIGGAAKVRFRRYVPGARPDGRDERRRNAIDVEVVEEEKKHEHGRDDRFLKG